MASKVLVVADDPVGRQVLGTILDVEGVDVESVAPGDGALERLDEGSRVDVVVIDTGDGATALRDRLRSDDPSSRSASVVVLTDHADDAPDDPEADVVVKPYSPLDLIDRVGRAAGGRR